jgi:Ca-activated chloride channel homolog
MRKLMIATLLFLFRGAAAFTQGVMITNGAEGEVMPMTGVAVKVDITDQVALVTATQQFLNTTQDTLYPKYAYPLPEKASAMRIRWMRADSVWHEASMVAQPQDTVLPGINDSTDVVAISIQQYLGTTPLYFRMLTGIGPGTTITMEITYVELLAYSNARVEFEVTKDLSPMISGTIPTVELEFIIRSQRQLMGADISGNGSWIPILVVDEMTADSLHATVMGNNVAANCGSSFGYDLDPAAYGLISLSNFLPDSLVKCDELGNGFFVLLIEPEPTSTVVPKSFVIVIDRSGSMSGSKIQEARDAASFMVSNMNFGDKFNVIAFDNSNVSWNAVLQPFNAGTMNSALAWIAQINANGGTNINGALLEGISNYGTPVSANTARTLVFLTDGQDNFLTDQQILSNVLAARLATAPDLQLFTFGVGAGYNEQLLNQLAVQNNGVASFIENANFSQVMNQFYLQIQNPVLLSPIASFDRPDVQNIHPDPLIGLYVGQQMVLVGRYDEPGPVELQLTGFAQGQPVTLNYNFDLTEEFHQNKMFVTKVWAQKAIDALMNEYYSNPLGSPAAVMLEDSVTSFSMCYGVSSPFTSFTDPGNGGGVTVGLEEEVAASARPLHVYPEPSMVGTSVTFDLSGFQERKGLMLRIMDLQGRVVLEVDLSKEAGDRWLWDGTMADGSVAAGQYLFTIGNGNTMRSGRITRVG